MVSSSIPPFHGPRTAASPLQGQVGVRNTFAAAHYQLVMRTGHVAPFCWPEWRVPHQSVIIVYFQAFCVRALHRQAAKVTAAPQQSLTSPIGTLIYPSFELSLRSLWG
jgi:hypothetical protein